MRRIALVIGALFVVGVVGVTIFAPTYFSPPTEVPEQVTAQPSSTAASTYSANVAIVATPASKPVSHTGASPTATASGPNLDPWGKIRGCNPSAVMVLTDSGEMEGNSSYKLVPNGKYYEMWTLFVLDNTRVERVPSTDRYGNPLASKVWVHSLEQVPVDRSTFVYNRNGMIAWGTPSTTWPIMLDDPILCTEVGSLQIGWTDPQKLESLGLFRYQVGVFPETKTEFFYGRKLSEEEIRFLIAEGRFHRGTFWNGVGWIGNSSSMGQFDVNKYGELLWKVNDEIQLTTGINLPLETELIALTTEGDVTKIQRFIIWVGHNGYPHMLEPESQPDQPGKKI